MIALDDGHGEFEVDVQAEFEGGFIGIKHRSGQGLALGQGFSLGGGGGGGLEELGFGRRRRSGRNAIDDLRDGLVLGFGRCRAPPAGLMRLGLIFRVW